MLPLKPALIAATLDTLENYEVDERHYLKVGILNSDFLGFLDLDVHALFLRVEVNVI